MERVTNHDLVVLAIFLVAFLTTAEGGRDVSTKGGEVYNPQAFWFPHFPWWWAGINEQEIRPKDMVEGETRNMEVPKVDDMASHEYLPKVDDMDGYGYHPKGGRDVATKEGEVYNPQAFRFPHFPWWWAGINKQEIRPKDMAEGETRNMEVPNVDDMASHEYLPRVDDMAGYGYHPKGGRDVATKGGEVYNPQAFWFPHFPWWWAGINKQEIRPKDMAEGETRNMEVPNVDDMASHKYLPKVDDMAGYGYRPKVDDMAGYGYHPKVDGMAGHGYP